MATKSKPPLKAVVRPLFPPTAPMPLDPYVPGDLLPVPEVIEKDSDSVWALWTDAVKDPEDKDSVDKDREERFNQTQPVTQLMDLQDLPKDSGA